MIIHGPTIDGNTCVQGVAYQMDIYPTVLAAIGCEDFFWKGFGVNLMDSASRSNRPISDVDAFDLSDKVIRSNRFEYYGDNLEK